MDHLAPSNVPAFETADERRAIWKRCRDRGQPVIAVREAERGYVVTDDLHTPTGRSHPTPSRRSVTASGRADPTRPGPAPGRAVGGEAGRVFGALHAPTEREARGLASHLAAFVFDRRNRR